MKVTMNIGMKMLTFMIISIVALIAIIIDWVILVITNDYHLAQWLFYKDVLILTIGSFGIYHLVNKYFGKASLESKRRSIPYQNLKHTIFTLIKKTNGEIVYTYLEGKQIRERGLNAQEAYQKTIRQLFGEDFDEYTEPFVERAFNGEELRFDVYDKNNHVLEVFLMPVFQSGVITEVYGEARDITRFKKHESELNTKVNQFNRILENISEGFIFINSHDVCTYANAQAARILLVSKEDIVGKGIAELFTEELTTPLHKLYQLACEEQYPIKQEVWQKKKCYDVRVYPSYDGCAIYIDDISEQKRSEEVIRKSDKLTVVGQLAAGVAHEIRNPLTSIKGFLQLIQSSSKDQDSIKYASIMINEIDRIELIISEFLVLAKPQAMKFQQHSIEDIINQTVLFIEAQANLQNIQIHTSFAENLPELMCEHNQLKQVFINLIKNAFEAMPLGGDIFIQVEQESSSHLLIVFKDEGEGISEEDIARIGEPFYTTKDKGTGLGLMVSYKILQNHQGTMQVQSEYGKGTSFYIRLPLARQDQENILPSVSY